MSSNVHNIKGDEHARIVEKLGREPNEVELGMFSVMWSEHCSYKSSRVHLKRLPTTGPRVLQGPGENAGVVDLGHGLAAVFKIESHNHPSFIEPFQGAATGSATGTCHANRTVTRPGGLPLVPAAARAVSPRLRRAPPIPQQDAAWHAAPSAGNRNPPRVARSATPLRPRRSDVRRCVLIEGDGIGPEVAESALRVLPLRPLVAVQAGAGLLALGGARGWE